MERRDVIQFASFALCVGLVLAGFGRWALWVFVVLQTVSALDLLLLLIGRFSPRATLWAIRLEGWLGPLPWSRS